MGGEDTKKPDEDECIVPSDAVPAEVVGKYGVGRDLHRERDIAGVRRV